MNKMDFKQFQSQRKHVNDINDYLCTGEGTPVSGFVYADMAYIEDTDDGRYYTIAERSEIITDSLVEAEHWIYNNWVKYL